MSLDTVLAIGKELKGSKNSLKHFKYVNSLSKNKKGEYTAFCISIPIKDDFSIDWNGVQKVRESELEYLYYLRFKTSDSDSLVKYIYGDIYYQQISKISKDGSIAKSEGGYFRLGNPESIPAFRKNSFDRGQADFEDITKSYEGQALTNFRKNLTLDLPILEKILGNISGVEAYFESFVQNNHDFLDYLNDDELFSKYALEQIYNKAATAKNLKKLGIDKPIEELTEDERKNLLNHDFGEIFIHFEFPNDKHWYEYEQELKLITDKMLADFVEKSNDSLVFKKTLYKTICSGDKKNDWQFPNFSVNNKHKSKAFSDEEILNLFYAINYSGIGRTISGTDIKIIVLPKGDNLKAKDYEEFLVSKNENSIKKANEKDDNLDDFGEPLFENLDSKENEKITSFDVIFCKKGGTSSPDVDLLEISGIRESNIKLIKQRFEDIGAKLAIKRKKYLRTQKNLPPFKLEFCFRNILGDPQFDQKSGKVRMKTNPRYQSHILKTLPLIYTENYFVDDTLLPAFIRNIEYSIRSRDNNNFGLLKFDIEYLFNIQNSPKDKFKEMTDSASYQIGKQLGQLSKPLGKAINSFEKSYVGLITRRVATKEDCIKFVNEIGEKRTRHGFKWAEMSANTITKIAAISLVDYNKEHIAFGFFEGYFTYEEKGSDPKKFYEKLETLLKDFQGNEKLENTIHQINSIINTEENA